VVRNIIVLCFNPNTKATYVFVTQCSTCVTAATGAYLMDNEIHKRATGVNGHPGTNFIIGLKQDHVLGFRSATTQGVELGVAYKLTYGTTPPLSYGTPYIDTNATLDRMHGEKDPALLRRMKAYKPDIFR